MSFPDLNTAYDVRATVSQDNFDEIMRRYRTASDEVVAGLDGHAGVVFDRRSGEKLDIWGVSSKPRPVVVFVHGGYWRTLSRHDSAFMAGMLAEQGIATVAVDYTLAPEASLEEIVRQVRSAVSWVYTHGAAYGLDPERVVVSGSSAGGHLTGMTLLEGWQEKHGVPNDVVKAAMLFSGLFDLSPLLHTFANDWLGLDAPRARALSPAWNVPDRRPPVAFVMADSEPAGFAEQTRQFHDLWASHSQQRAELHVVPERNHFDVVLDLVVASSRASRTLVDLVRSV